MTLLANIALTLLSIAIGLFFALPVVREMNDGVMAALHGAGPASAAMVYVLTVPILAMLAHTGFFRLLTILLGTVAALATRTWVGFLEQGRTEAAVLLMAAAGLAAAGLLLALRAYRHRRRRRVGDLTRAHSAMAADIGAGLRRRYAATAPQPNQDTPIRQVILVEELVFGLIAEAAFADDQEGYARVLLAGLADMEESLGTSSRIDPSGYAAIAFAEFKSRLGGDLRRRVPDAAPPRRTRTDVATTA